MFYENGDRFSGTEKGIVYRHLFCVTRNQERCSSWTPTPTILGLVVYCPMCKMVVNGLWPTSAKILSKAQRNYCVTSRAVLAIVKTPEQFQKYLYVQEFHLLTDHSALTWLLCPASIGVQFHVRTSSKHPTHQRNAISRRPFPEDCSHCQKVEQRADGQRVRIVATAAANCWDRQALRREQLADNDLGPLIREMEAGQRPEWKDISDWGPIYKSYWAKWKSLTLRDGVLERHGESADGKKKTAQIVIPHSKMKEVLAVMHGGTTGGHLGANKIIDKVRQRYYWLHLRGDVERFCQQCDTCAASRGPRTRSRG